jgi:hypothetical protein
MVLDSHIAIYKDILSGAPHRLYAPIHEAILPPLLPGDSKRKPCWVEWDKTPRNPDFPKEAFYVAREDGRIMYAERGLTGTVETIEAGVWPYRIDSAFACLSVDNSEFSQSYPDVLIAGGVGNDGRLCKLGSWPAEYSYAVPYPGSNQLSYVESIANWTPLSEYQRFTSVTAVLFSSPTALVLMAKCQSCGMVCSHLSITLLVAWTAVQGFGLSISVARQSNLTGRLLDNTT